jgi:hypothetical protein
MRTVLVAIIGLLAILAGIGWDKYLTLRNTAPPFLSCDQGVSCVTLWDEQTYAAGWLRPTAYACKLASYALIEGMDREETVDNLVFVNHRKEAIYCVNSDATKGHRVAPDANVLIPKLGDWSSWQCIESWR